MKRFMPWRWLVTFVLVGLVVLVAACGSAPSTGGASTDATATSAATAVPTDAATDTPSSPTIVPGAVGKLNNSSVHRCQNPGSDTSAFITLGDLRVARVNYAMAYPSDVLTNVTSGKPYKLSLDASQDLSTAGPPANPTLNSASSGYAFDICNTSKSTSHIIRSVSVSISKFSAYSGSVATWQVCDGYYKRPNGASGGGCGGGYMADELLKATFPTTAASGASVVAKQVGTGLIDAPDNHEPAPPLPVSLGPNQEISINVLMAPPTATGWYTFDFALSFDGGSPGHISSMPAVLLDTNVQKWDGAACTTSAMQALIPASDTTGMYVCQE